MMADLLVKSLANIADIVGLANLVLSPVANHLPGPDRGREKGRKKGRESSLELPHSEPQFVAPNATRNKPA